MPPPRKVDLLPSEVRLWLQEMLKQRGFAGYEELTEDLNFKLAEEGVELRLGKSAVHAYGQEFQEYARMHEEANDEIRVFMEQMSASEEVDMTSALFQQLLAIQWRLQKTMMTDVDNIDARGMKDLTTALNNLIRSTDLREKIAADERAKMAAVLQEGVDAGDIQEDYMILAKQKMGFG